MFRSTKFEDSNSKRKDATSVFDYDSVRRGMQELRYPQYMRDISKNLACLIVSINSDTKLGCFASTLSLMCCHVFYVGFR